MGSPTTAQASVNGVLVPTPAMMTSRERPCCECKGSCCCDREGRALLLLLLLAALLPSAPAPAAALEGCGALRGVGCTTLKLCKRSRSAPFALGVLLGARVTADCAQAAAAGEREGASGRRNRRSTLREPHSAPPRSTPAPLPLLLLGSGAVVASVRDSSLKLLSSLMMLRSPVSATALPVPAKTLGSGGGSWGAAAAAAAAAAVAAAEVAAVAALSAGAPVPSAAAAAPGALSGTSSSVTLPPSLRMAAQRREGGRGAATALAPRVLTARESSARVAGMPASTQCPATRACSRSSAATSLSSSSDRCGSSATTKL